MACNSLVALNLFGKRIVKVTIELMIDIDNNNREYDNLIAYSLQGAYKMYNLFHTLLQAFEACTQNLCKPSDKLIYYMVMDLWMFHRKLKHSYLPYFH